MSEQVRIRDGKLDRRSRDVNQQLEGECVLWAVREDFYKAKGRRQFRLERSGLSAEAVEETHPWDVFEDLR